MSDIDAVQNVHVAKFKGNINMYWPMENVSMDKVVRNAGSKTLTPEHILLGGGAGEHSALVIYSDAVVLQTLIYDSLFNTPESWDGHAPDVVAFFKKNEKLHNKYSYGIENPLFDAIRGSWSMDTNQWPLQSWVSFIDSLDKDDLLSEDTPERVMIDMLGVFILEQMPLVCLMDNDIREMAELYRKNKESLRPYMKQGYIDKLLGYFTEPKQGEMCGTIHENGETRWGYNLSDWKKDNNQRGCA